MMVVVVVVVAVKVVVSSSHAWPQPARCSLLFGFGPWSTWHHMPTRRTLDFPPSLHVLRLGKGKVQQQYHMIYREITVLRVASISLHTG